MLFAFSALSRRPSRLRSLKYGVSSASTCAARAATQSAWRAYEICDSSSSRSIPKSFVKSSPPNATATMRSLARQICATLTMASAVSIHGTRCTVPKAKPARVSSLPMTCEIAAMSPALRTLPTEMPKMCAPTTASRSAWIHSVSSALTRGITGRPEAARRGRSLAIVSRAFTFSAAGTESSMSGTSASGATVSAFSSMLALLPGTNSGLRRITPQRLTPRGSKLLLPARAALRVAPCGGRADKPPPEALQAPEQHELVIAEVLEEHHRSQREQLRRPLVDVARYLLEQQRARGEHQPDRDREREKRPKYPRADEAEREAENHEQIAGKLDDGPE